MHLVRQALYFGHDGEHQRSDIGTIISSQSGCIEHTNVGSRNMWPLQISGKSRSIIENRKMYLLSTTKLLLVLFAMIYFVGILVNTRKLTAPIVINTWNFTDANVKAWQELEENHSALDAVEKGCSQCEIDRCDGTVGWGGSPSETGETTLDAMIMDGETYDVGAVGGIRRIKSAISVARLVLERTNHTLLVGDMATKFAVGFGFQEESLTSKESTKIHQEWLDNSCQPNFWKNVSPDPRKSCGPYKPIPLGDRAKRIRVTSSGKPSRQDAGGDFAPSRGHDTIGMVAMDSSRRLASGTSTNGLRHKILGRVGDSPVPGAGSYAAKEAGAAAATGDGDVMMRFLLSYQAVENLRRGMSADEAAHDVIMRQVSRTGRPYPEAAVIVLSKDGSYGAACSGFARFPYLVSDMKSQQQLFVLECMV